jgi:hypothetical protein
MVRDDAVANAQPQARPFAHLLGGEERIKYALQVLPGYARPIVTESDQHMAVDPFGGNGQDAFAVRFDHGELGVKDDIEEDLLHL